MIDIEVVLSRHELSKFRILRQASAKLAAQSLTFTAEKAQGDWRDEMRRLFHLRRPWLPKGVRIVHATPATMTAKVGSIDAYFGRHVEGVDEQKESGGKKLFVPVEAVERQGTHTQIRSALRRMDRTKTKPFLRGSTLFRRLGRGHDAPLKVLAVLRDKVDIDPRFDAQGITERAVRREFLTVYERLLLRWAATQ